MALPFCALIFNTYITRFSRDKKMQNTQTYLYVIKVVIRPFYHPVKTH